MISQKALDHFRTSLAGKKDDPYSVLLKRNKLPMALLDDALNPNTRKVCRMISVPNLTKTDGMPSALTSSRQNHLTTLLAPKPSVKSPESTQELLKNLES